MNTTNRYNEGDRFFGSDLALERRKADTDCPGVEYKKERSLGGVWERIRIRSEEGAKSIGRPIGIYDTLSLPRMDTLDYDGIDDAKDEIARELCKMCDSVPLSPRRILVVGLGNESLTPDAIGPKTAKLIEPTMHIRYFDEDMFESLDCSEIAVLRPGVTGESGIETCDIVRGVCDRIHPDAVFAVDAIASRSPERLGTTIQISGTGIFPGSGLGNGRCPINQQTVGVPVIAIGVPTVIDSRLFTLSVGNEKSEKNNMFVSPKEIDGIVEKAAEIIAGGINQAFGITFQ